jgi:hypothetical protein
MKKSELRKLIREELLNEAKLPKNNSTIDVGGISVKITHAGKDNNYIGYSWKNDSGKERYEETPMSSHKNLKSLIKTIKDEMR